MPEVQSLTCPFCASTVNVPPDAGEAKCQYCGNTVVVAAEARPAQATARAGAATPKRKGPPLPARVLFSAIAVVALAAAILLFGVFKGARQAAPSGAAAGPPTGFAHELLSFGGEGTAPGLFQDARHIAVDPRGVIYVDDVRTMRVQRFDGAGRHLGTWTVDERLCTNPSVSLNTIAADREGHVYVLYCGSILKYDGVAGTLIARFSGSANSPRDFYMDVVTRPDGGILVLADGAPNAHEVLLRLDADGKVRARYPNPVSKQSPQRPASAMTLEMAIDGLGNIFLLNKDDYAVYRFTPSGTYVSKFGSVGTGAGQFDTWAQHLAIDNQSRVYVTDFSGLKRFDANGAYLDSMSARAVVGALEMRITDKNEIFTVGGNTVFKLAVDR